jgi:hypothetical protein
VDFSSGRPSAISSPEPVVTSVSRRVGDETNATIYTLA